MLVGWIASAFFCAQVADEKGYNGMTWAFAGFIFGFFALIAVAGLPDRKLRKYIRQIGEKQKAIEKVGERVESKDSEWVEKSSGILIRSSGVKVGTSPFSKRMCNQHSLLTQFILNL